MISVYLHLCFHVLSTLLRSDAVLAVDHDRQNRQIEDISIELGAESARGTQRSALSSSGAGGDLPCSQSGYCSLGKVKPWRGRGGGVSKEGSRGTYRLACIAWGKGMTVAMV